MFGGGGGGKEGRRGYLNENDRCLKPWGGGGVLNC